MDHTVKSSFFSWRIALLGSLLLSLVLVGCDSHSSKKEMQMVVISAPDSLAKNTNIPQPAPPDFHNRFYTDLVFILDSVDNVHVYQTAKCYNYEVEGLPDYHFPNFIELRPEDLVTLNSDSFISFFKNNIEIDDPEGVGRRKHYYFASETDTIKNRALYDFFDHIRKSRRAPFYIIRRTTEEENKVLEFKKQRRFYAPQLISWSANFLNGSCKPYTADYKKVESQIRIFRKAKTTFDPELNTSVPNL